MHINYKYIRIIERSLYSIYKYTYMYMYAGNNQLTCFVLKVFH